MWGEFKEKKYISQKKEKKNVMDTKPHIHAGHIYHKAPTQKTSRLHALILTTLTLTMSLTG